MATSTVTLLAHSGPTDLEEQFRSKSAIHLQRAR